ncbi:Levansucrase [Labeo rohita]|uniref:Levansucrase n=1 Tax=Labeo rohita TaxID=84645 RepID=A0ABQ8L6A0_LABRO|nr:Levansucrase [Labeo rohita]
MASVMDPSLMSVRAASIPVTSVPSSPTIIDCAPEASSVHKSTPVPPVVTTPSAEPPKGWRPLTNSQPVLSWLWRPSLNSLPILSQLKRLSMYSLPVLTQLWRPSLNFLPVLSWQQRPPLNLGPALNWPRRPSLLTFIQGLLLIM